MSIPNSIWIGFAFVIAHIFRTRAPRIIKLMRMSNEGNIQPLSSTEAVIDKRGTPFQTPVVKLAKCSSGSKRQPVSPANQTHPLRPYDVPSTPPPLVYYSFNFFDQVL
jgi:hypothetical protein